MTCQKFREAELRKLLPVPRQYNAGYPDSRHVFFAERGEVAAVVAIRANFFLYLFAIILPVCVLHQGENKEQAYRPKRAAVGFHKQHFYQP